MEAALEVRYRRRGPRIAARRSADPRSPAPGDSGLLPRCRPDRALRSSFSRGGRCPGARRRGRQRNDGAPLLARPTRPWRPSASGRPGLARGRGDRGRREALGPRPRGQPRDVPAARASAELVSELRGLDREGSRAIVPAVRHQVARMDPALPVADAHTLESAQTVPSATRPTRWRVGPSWPPSRGTSGFTG